MGENPMEDTNPNNDDDQQNTFSCSTGNILITQDDVIAFGNLGCNFVPSLLIGDLNNTNSNINDISALSSLTDVGVLAIGNTTNLTNLNGLQNITEIDILIIRENTALENINALSSLIEVTGNIQIFDNDNLTNLEGLNSLELVINGLDIANNDGLTSIDGLDSFTQAFGGVRIIDNSNLQNVDGLSNLIHIDEGVAPNSASLPNDDDMVISSNPMLNDLCGITALIEADSDPNTSQGISGMYIVSGNAFNPSENDILNGDCSN
ncbi:hypothetical protein GCM10011344_27450 [Dokdonia pacifica]|nr:hypothetical protein [Dokdonia pacifica]GGG25291.1 hypothetical protein GCM10011344_27450 [Dokdonia pacifica]